MNMTIGMVREWAFIMRVASDAMMCILSTHLRTAFFTAVQPAVLWKVSVTGWITTAQIINATLVSGLDPLASLVSLKSQTTASSVRLVIHGVFSCTVCSSLAHERSWVGQILDAGRSADTGLSAKVLSVSWLTTLRIKAATSSNAASHHRDTLGNFSTAIAAPVEGSTRRFSQSARSNLGTTLALCHICSLRPSFLEFAIKRLEEILKNAPELEEKNMARRTRM